MAGFLSKPPDRRLLAALAISLLLHFWLSGGIDLPTFVEPPPSPPIEARLSQPVAPLPTRSTRPAQPAVGAAKAAAESLLPSATALPAEPAVRQIEPAPPQASAHAALPEAFKIRFSVQGNEGGLVLGRLNHVWRRSGERYALVGVAEASGLFALFYSGLLTQTSDGSITAEGLRPESYWMQRGRRQYSAHFDWVRQTARLGDPYGAVPLALGAQDYLSVVYQLALFPHPASGRVAVVDGKRVKEYVYSELGTEAVELPLGQVEAIHLRIGQNGEEGDMELWLRAQAPHLPLKMFLIDNQGRKGVLLAEAIE